MLESGEKIGRYLVKSLLGTGGMGQVYLAEDAQLERLVALKILRTNVAENAETNRRFVREAKAASALNHPNILTIYEIGEVNGWRYMASEFVKGNTLSNLIKQKTLSLLQTLEIALQVVSALAVAHKNGIVHRDIKPDNLMVREDNLVKILDFGIAKLIEDKTQSITLTGAIIGTPHYMSPEQAEGDKPDTRTDLWSFGAVFYEMLTGEKAFAGNTLSEIIVSLMIKTPKSICEINPEIPPEIETIVNKLLSKNREDRYQSADDVVIILQSVKKQLELKADLREVNVDVSSPNKSPQSPNNLVEDLSSIVGRENEVNEICDLLRKEEIRLLTLTGIGGTGKTRLSQKVANEMIAEFTGGVFFIELAEIANPDLFAPTIAQPLHIKESSGKTIFESLKESLRERKVLLVLDNFEQITSAAPMVAELLAVAPHLKILVTSREILRLRIEREYKVPALKLPSADSHTEELLKNEAVKLFVERARNLKPNFAENSENMQAVAEICVRLEGLPLAIEFAAARIRILSPQAILSKLENRLQLLTGGAQDLPTRQQTMRGAIEWSYDLLDENEKILFRRLAVFAGGFRFDAAESIINFPNQRLNVLDGITSLLDKSLIIGKEQTDGELRFQMLEVVREYAFEMLQFTGELAVVKQNHAEYFLALGEKNEPLLFTSESANSLNELESENDNLRNALRYFFANDSLKALRLAAAIRNFWVFRGHITEGCGWLKSARELAETVDGEHLEIRFKLVDVLGWLTILQGDYETAQNLYLESLATGTVTDNLDQMARATRGLGRIMLHRGDLAMAQKYYEESLTISRQTNDKTRIATALSSLGNLALMQDDSTTARSLFEESLAISQEAKFKQLIVSGLINLGTTTNHQGDYQKAREYYTESLAAAQEVGERIIISYALDGFASLSTQTGDFERGAKLSGAAEALLSSIGAEFEPIERKLRQKYMAQLRAELGENGFTPLYEFGRKMRLDEAIKLGLEEL